MMLSQHFSLRIHLVLLPRQRRSLCDVIHIGSLRDILFILVPYVTSIVTVLQLSHTQQGKYFD